MRHLKSYASHRMRRRRPSIFTAGWFRLLLGGGVAIILGLLVGPPVAGWLRGDPAGTPVVLRPDPTSTPNGAAAIAPKSSEARAVPMRNPEPAAVAAPVTNEPAVPTASAIARHPSGNKVATFRVQVGAFLDHRNADRLVERLRGENLEVVDSVVEHSRILYRVLARPPEGEAYEAFLERVRRLGFTPEVMADGAAVMAPVPLHIAVETSRRLRDSGIRVRLERAVSAAAFRVVRVGRFATADDAERARAELTARGVEGFVVREP